jgi:hypothetical protein
LNRLGGSFIISDAPPAALDRISLAVPTLPDPRCFAATTDDPLVRLAAQQASAASAPQRDWVCPEVIARLRVCAAAGRDDEIAASLRAATSAPVYRCLWESLTRAVLPDSSAGLLALPFAFPLLIVTGGRAPARVPAVLADAERVRDVLGASGVLGPARNFGLGNGLCSLAALESLPPSRLYGLAREISAGVLDLPPAEIAVTTSDEQVHLRFLLGAALTPAHAPTFLETGSAIAAWGLALTRELSEQLRVEGLSVLPIPRPPAALLRAQELGRRAREELAFQAFVSRALRRFRAEIGEPDVTVAALDGPAVGIRLASELIEDRIDVHAWALHPLDDLEEIAASVIGLLRECRVDNVQVLPGVASAEAFAVNRA